MRSCLFVKRPAPVAATNFRSLLPTRALARILPILALFSLLPLPRAHAAAGDPVAGFAPDSDLGTVVAATADSSGLPESGWSDGRLDLAIQRARSALRYEVRAGSHPGDLAVISINPGAPGQIVVAPEPGRVV